MGNSKMGREGYVTAKRFIDFIFNGIYKIFSGCREVAAKVRGVRSGKNWYY
jgi:hypothetical protein